MLRAHLITHLGYGPFDLDVSPGERVVLMGPSGIGKSLLLRAIADLDPNSGEVHLDNVSRETLDAPIWRRRVGYLAAQSGWWEPTVGAHFPTDTRSAAKILFEQLGLETSALNWDVGRLSSGERQRLALARLLVNTPDVLLLDEPTSGLDHGATLRVEAVLKAYAAAGNAIVCVTHDKAQARRFATRTLTVDHRGLRGGTKQHPPSEAPQ
ncbi:ABC transporter ATP-binding protein [Varunaivibrio sulfuroxidans]|uniref:ABC-type iron transport system FetAB ATPase subunit n=1 Tax=Varunaivibrio sulfuroxidans TaxID=1773489 RepID=A0A4R3JDS5_9PROT|nr:ATP-binding cassette domain-containing protein [Varunaivibrio sulfuroxidans]TCS63575.1 ABC-type iron transport system FetAB ATPase subunit [Varunaivibrio sulfuroxidans]WES30282.1 ATP-binding cassette domain-containing protein [Varunaivibrio sulfuroxidans]